MFSASRAKSSRSTLRVLQVSWRLIGDMITPLADTVESGPNSGRTRRQPKIRYIWRAMVVEGVSPSRRPGSGGSKSKSSHRRPPTSPSHAKTILVKQHSLAAPTSSLTEDQPTSPQRKSQPHATNTMVVVESMFRDAVDVVKTSFTSPCACASGDDSRHKEEQPEKKKQEKGGRDAPEKTNTNNISKITGVSISSFRRPNKSPLSAISSSTLSVDSSDKSTSVGNQEAVAAAERRLAEAERRLAAAIAFEKQYQQQEQREEEARDQSMDDPRRTTTNRRHGRHDDGFSRIDTSDGYGLIPEQITFETTSKEMATNPRKSSSGMISDRPPIAKPPISKNRLGSAHVATSSNSANNKASGHERTPSDGSGESFIQGEMLLSTSGDEHRGCGVQNSHHHTTSVFTSYSSASEAATDDVNSSAIKTRSGLSSPSRISTREDLTVTTASPSSPHDPHDTPVVPFSPGAHSSCTNPSYISSSSEEGDDDDLFELESLQGDLYKVVQMQQRYQQHQQYPGDEDDDEGPKQHHQSSLEVSSGMVVGEVITKPESSNAVCDDHEEYNIQEGSNGGRPKPDLQEANITPNQYASPSAGKLGKDSEGLPASSSFSRRFFSEQSSSLSLDVIDSSVASPRSESTRGGLASLDAILMASSSLSVDSDDDTFVLQDGEEERCRVQMSTPTQSEISESLRSALEELQAHDDDDDDNDSFNYASVVKEGEEVTRSLNKILEAKGNVRKMEPEGLLLKSADANVVPIFEVVDTSNPDKNVAALNEPATSFQDRRFALSDLSSERAPVRFLNVSVPSLGSFSVTSIEEDLKEKTRLVVKELEQEYQERVEGIKRQYSAKLKRLRHQLDIQFEHDLQEQMDRAEIDRYPRIETSEHTSSRNDLGVETSESNYTTIVDETRSVQSTLLTPKYVGDMNLSISKKERKEAMEERLQSLMLKLNAPATSTKTTQSNNCSVDLTAVESPPKDDDGVQSVSRTHDADDGTCDLVSASIATFPPQQTNYSTTKLTKEETSIPLMRVKSVYESQQNWLEVDLEHDADEKAESLLIEFETYRRRQARAFSELQAQERQYLIEQEKCREEIVKAGKVHKNRFVDAKAKLQQLRDDNEELCAGLKYEIGREENTIEELTSSLKDIQEYNASLQDEANEQTNRIEYLRAESVEVQERLKKLAMMIDEEDDEHEIQLGKERAKTDKAIVNVEAEVSAGINKQFKEGDKKKEALSDTQRKVEERLSALQKLLVISESSRASSYHDWNVREMELIDECTQLTRAALLTEERKSNKGVAFERVCRQLNESYQALSETIDTSRKEVETCQGQAEKVKSEILHLKKENEQVSSWISELDTVLKSMGKDVPSRKR